MLCTKQYSFLGPSTFVRPRSVKRSSRVLARRFPKTGSTVPQRCPYCSRPHGTVLRQFGDVPADGQFESTNRLLAIDPRGGFWSARGSRRYELQQWRAPGELANTYERSTASFPAITREARISPTEPPSAQLSAMWVDSVGTVWIVGAAADPEWYTAIGSEQVSQMGHDVYPVLDFDRLYDTMIERWDPKTPTLLFSERLDEVCLLSAGPWSRGRQTEDGDGFVKVELVRVVPR
jgi:hypothetical protein